MSGYENLLTAWNRREPLDYSTGLRAFHTYRTVMLELADAYGYPLETVTGVFVTLSPNSDYLGNLRSAATCLKAHAAGVPQSAVPTSSYNHCRDRAWRILDGEAFTAKRHGRKITAFYENIMSPNTSHAVTVDGHIHAIYEGEDDWTMRDGGKLNTGKYQRIERAFCLIADALGILPHQLAATLWFGRKRRLAIRSETYAPLLGESDPWGLYIPVDKIKPYPILGLDTK